MVAPREQYVLGRKPSGGDGRSPESYKLLEMTLYEHRRRGFDSHEVHLL
jgi:hypothetical protein